MNRRFTLAAMTALLLSTAAIAQPPDSQRSTDVNRLIDRVAAELGREVVVDPRLPSEMRGYTTEDDADYDSFLALLRINGYAAITTADQLLVIPEENSRSSPTLILQDDNRNISDHEIVTRVISLPRIPDRRTEAQIRAQTETNPFAPAGGELAPQLVPVLRPMLSQSAQLAAAGGLNKLIIVDRYDNVRRITAVIEELIEDIED